MQRSKSLAMVFLLGVFLAGGAAGFAAHQVTTPRTKCGGDRASYRERFATELGLTASQREAVDSLMEMQRTRVRALYSPMRPQLDSIGRSRDSIFEDTQRQLKALLTPEQQARFDRMRREGRARKK
jgi:Spy/CpxP family protein refolding chaperone